VGDEGNLKRAINPMPAEIREALETRVLRAAHEERPAYQRNDYLGWIGRAKRPETEQKRLHQMLDSSSAAACT